MGMCGSVVWLHQQKPGDLAMSGNLLPHYTHESVVVTESNEIEGETKSDFQPPVFSEEEAALLVS